MRHRLTRRSFLLRVGAATPALVIVTGATGSARAQSSDADTGPQADRPGARGTPSPSGPQRRRRRSTGVTDQDPSDPVGAGRRIRRSGITDRDPYDPAGNGSGPMRSRPRPTGFTDGDTGPNADFEGNGRGPR